jgi:aminopeptidase N
MELLNANSYQKGGWVLHMLRRELGDSIFWKSIRKYYATYAGSIAGTEDLQKVFEEVSGKDLYRFFKQWLYTPGQPNLDMEWKYNNQLNEVSITVTQTQSDVFFFPLEIVINYYSGNPEKRKLVVDRKIKTFNFPVLKKPESIQVDPGTALLFNGYIRELR